MSVRKILAYYVICTMQSKNKMCNTIKRLKEIKRDKRETQSL